MGPSSRDGVGQVGVGLAMAAFERLDMAFRTQPERDFGIDAHAEVVDGAKPTGRLLALQVKTGPSYLAEVADGGFVFRFDAKHFEYWVEHALPVVVVLCDPDSGHLYWQRVAVDTCTDTGKGWKVIVPEEQRVDVGSVQKLRDAATQMPASETYSILEERDVSHGMAKRYSVGVLLNSTVTKSEIAAIIREVTTDQMGSDYYRNHLLENRWKNVDAHVVWTFVFASYSDFTASSPICRSQWIDPQLDTDSRPIGLSGENVGLSIMVDWSPNYRELARIVADDRLSKSEYLREADRVVQELAGAVDAANDSLRRTAGNEQMAEGMEKTATIISELYDQASRLGSAPIECRDLDLCLQAVAAHAHNIVLPFTPRGKKTWKPEARHAIARPAVQMFHEELARLRYEREKV